ncbi:MAG TPA: prenyltransferase/squalene oxidase repeat-containing protein [Solirubrobacterales bacterium]|nr:prenyltransferase/squalene oxidase repeat-containing protein [Solirubrobacterales bacterium]
MAAVVLVLAVVAPAGAATVERQKTIDSTVRFLQESQRPNGGFANPGRKPSQSVSAWVALALAAAGINPQDQATCGVDAFTYLETHFAESFREEAAWPDAATTAFERELLVVDAAGTDPHDFAGYDLVAEILARQLPNGSFPFVPGGRGEINDTAFAVLALSPVAEPDVNAAIGKALDWLATQQNDGGAWSWQVQGLTDNVDLTGGVLEAFNAAERPGTEAQARALTFLHQVQRPDGGFSETGGGESNVASTAWAVQGLWAAGEDPETWRTGSGLPSEEPLDYMESLQQTDGHVRWKQSSDMNGIWMTAYVMPAFAGQALPVSRVPRALPSASAAAANEMAAAELPASCSETPSGGGEATPPGSESPRQAEGVIAGGGGFGAPNFSRPKPQSRGKTPGGARVVGNQGLRSRNHSESRRGDNADQPRGTETAEPSDEQADESQPAVVGGSGGEKPGTGSGTPGAEIADAPDETRADGGEKVTGTLIGSTGASQDALAFGAPGLRSGGSEGGSAETWVAIGIGGLALAGAVGGSQWERRRRVVLP